VLDQLPHVAAFIGDLAEYSETRWIELLTGQDVLLRESIRRRLAQLKRELTGEHPTAIERILVDSIASCNLPDRTPSPPATATAMRLKRAESCQKKLMGAIKTLAMVRTSMSRGLVPADAPRLFRPEPEQRHPA